MTSTTCHRRRASDLISGAEVAAGEPLRLDLVGCADTRGGAVTSTGQRRSWLVPVTFEHHREALGIGEARPRISWTVGTEEPDWVQRAYEVRVTGADGSSCHVGPDRRAGLGSRAVAGRGARRPGTASGERAGLGRGHERADRLERAVAGGDRAAGAGRLVGATDQPRLDRGHLGGPTARRCSAATSAPTARSPRRGCMSPRTGCSRRRSTASGSAGTCWRPGWSSYRHRLRYHTYDVTDLLRAGDNAIGVTVADGWFRGHVGFDGGLRNIYGERLALLAQLEIRYADGAVGHRRHRRELAGRSRCDRSVRDLCRRDLRRAPGTGRVERSRIRRRRVEQRSSPRRRRRTVGGAERSTRAAHRGGRGRSTCSPRPSGRTIADFGQNLVGRVRITVSGTAGQTVTLRHAEVLEHGELGTRPLRLAEATDRYTLRRRRRRDLGATVHHPRLPLRRDRRVARRAAPGRSSCGRAAFRHEADRVVLLLRRAAEQAARERRCGACAATSSTCPPTARNATSGWAGPATSRCSHRPRRSSTTAPGCWRPGWRTWRRNRRNWAPCRCMCPTSNRSSRWRRSRPGVTPR